MQAGGVAAIVLAAGASSRFGRPKTLAHLWGRPLLLYVLDAVAARRDRGGRRRARPRRRGDRGAVCPGGRNGASAIQRRRPASPVLSVLGSRTLSPARDAALILLGDQPLVRVDVIERLLAEPGFPGPAHRHAPDTTMEAARIHFFVGFAPPGSSSAKHSRIVASVRSCASTRISWTVLDFDGSNPDIDTPDELAGNRGFARPPALIAGRHRGTGGIGARPSARSLDWGHGRDPSIGAAPCPRGRVAPEPRSAATHPHARPTGT